MHLCLGALSQVPLAELTWAPQSLPLWCQTDRGSRLTLDPKPCTYTAAESSGVVRTLKKVLSPAPQSATLAGRARLWVGGELGPVESLSRP